MALATKSVDIYIFFAALYRLFSANNHQLVACMTTISVFLLALNMSLFHTSCSHYVIITLHLMCLRDSATPFSLLFNIAPKALAQGRSLKSLLVRSFLKISAHVHGHHQAL